jgi:hypothetical protein
MTRRNELRWFFTLLFFVAAVFPFISVFNKQLLLGGIPILYLYLFGLWIVVIGISFRLTKRPSQ